MTKTKINSLITVMTFCFMFSVPTVVSATEDAADKALVHCIHKGYEAYEHAMHECHKKYPRFDDEGEYNQKYVECTHDAYSRMKIGELRCTGDWREKQNQNF